MGTTLAKNTQGYGYKYTELAEINEYLDSQGITYYQYIEPIDGEDYIYTVPIIDGKERSARRGCKVCTATLTGKSNPAQEQGSAITYARRYSLLMAFGLATADDDAACLTRPKKEEVPHVEAEVVNETPKKEKKEATGFPSRKVMITIAEKHYPKDSDNYKKLLETFNAKSIEDMTDDQLKAVYSKFGGR